MTRNELYKVCKDWMEKQDKLELRWDYDDYLDDDQARKFLDYCEEEIIKGNIMDAESYLYDYLCWNDGRDWFNSYEHDGFYDHFVKPFMDEHEDLDYDESWLDEILWDLMYDLDKYDANLKHFNRIDYNFYILTDPEKTIYIPDYPYKKKFPEKWFKKLKKSQGRTDTGTSMKTLYDGAWGTLGICIHYNCSLFDMVDRMKAKRWTITKGSSIYLFEPFQGSGGVETELDLDWTFNVNLKELGFGVDGARRGPWGYIPNEVYGWVHSYFDKNGIIFKSLKK